MRGIGYSVPRSRSTTNHKPQTTCATVSRALIAMSVVALMLVGAVAEARDITLAKGGKSSYTIVLSKDASLSEKHGAKELQKFLKDISGAELPIVTEGSKLPKRMIVLGDSEALRSLKVNIDFKDLGEEGFAIKTAGSNLVIAGGRLRGTMYGVYTLLEDVLGCRWYTPYASYIPKLRTIKLKKLDIVQKPDFEYREPFYTSAWDADWAARNKTTGNSTKLDDERGGKVIYGRFCHSFDELVPTAKYFADHPEYYSLINGKRVGGQAAGQLCLTNPEVLKIVTANLLEWIAENPKAKIWSVTQNDNYAHCQCDKCQAVDVEEGSPSGLMLRFVNAVADEVGKKYPNVLIDTFAYQYTEKPPKITKPLPNVRVRLCPIGCCEHHPYEKCEKNTPFMDNLRGWRNITDCLYIWHYNTNFANYLLPLPDLEELAADIPMYKQFQVRGVFTQGTYTAGGNQYGGGGFMDDLKAFMISKMLWNTRVDTKVVIADFLNGYFGKSGKPIGQFLDLLHNKVRTENIHGYIWDNPLSAPALTPDIMTESGRLFDEAEKVADSPEILARVKHARLSLEYLNVMRQANNAANSGKPAEKAEALRTLEAFTKQCETEGITNWSEGTPIRERFEQLAAPLK